MYAVYFAIGFFTGVCALALLLEIMHHRDLQRVGDTIVDLKIKTHRFSKALREAKKATERQAKQ